MVFVGIITMSVDRRLSSAYWVQEIRCASKFAAQIGSELQPVVPADRLSPRTMLGFLFVISNCVKDV